MTTGKKPLIVRFLKGVLVTMLVVIILLAASVALLWFNRPVVIPPGIVNTLADWDATLITYNGPGTLIVYMDATDPLLPRGDGVVVKDPIGSDILGEKRPLLVYLPPGYGETADPYPLFLVLHGFGGRGQSMADIYLPIVEEAVSGGILEPSVLVFVDFSISANGMNDPNTDIDERGGTWYVNSNLGRFEDHFIDEIVPFAFETFNVRTDPDGVILTGKSMGGYGSVYYSIRYPWLSHIIVPFYPAADLRYGIDGDKLAPYDPLCFARIDTDDAKRIVNAMVMGDLLALSEEWLYYPVFNSDSSPGPVWYEDLPVWERYRKVSPVEMLENDIPDLNGHRYWLTVGGDDDFNFDEHVKILVPLLEKSGAVVHPEDPIIPGGRHSVTLIDEYLPEILVWVNEEMQSPYRRP